MTNNNSKHAVANRSIAVSWKFVLLFRLIDVVFGQSTVSSHIAATTIVIIFEDFFIFTKFLFSQKESESWLQVITMVYTSCWIFAKQLKILVTKVISRKSQDSREL